ncbi:MAG: type I methionyl aminopeptidase [Anaerolineales bacterium]|nr:type I methionyl aminopeptidase [Anaerolineales bacterium]MCB8954194.1 type I methionyl aminopeptidase [Ardenticatenales bacterium]
MIILKSQSELKTMREAGRINAHVLEAVREAIHPGVTTLYLNDIAERVLEKHGATPIFKGYSFGGKLPPYPGALNTCINEELVHAIPSSKRIIREGDLVSIDCGTLFKGYIGDSAFSIGVGSVSAEVEMLLTVTEQALQLGIAQAVAGNRIGDISAAIQDHVESHGYNVVRGYGGHGVGRSMHEEPHVPNYGKAGRGVRLRPRMTFAIEPMVLQGKKDVIVMPDQWTVAAKDGKLTAHFEHTIAITDNGPEILTLP